ncbi:MAG: hypothetical protein LBE05_05830 [Microbacterium sp.]|jgi:hypothetical protein|nr:hypothetical protein [Microbacterium sp.]
MAEASWIIRVDDRERHLTDDERRDLEVNLRIAAANPPLSVPMNFGSEEILLYPDTAIEYIRVDAEG